MKVRRSRRVPSEPDLKEWLHCIKTSLNKILQTLPELSWTYDTTAGDLRESTAKPRASPKNLDPPDAFSKASDSTKPATSEPKQGSKVETESKELDPPDAIL